MNMTGHMDMGHDPFKPHGAWLGHLVPGILFITWGSWWLFSSLRLYMRSTPHQPYASRTWFEFPGLGKVPLEPMFIIFGTFIGINGELWFGQSDWYTNMFNADGTFNSGHMNNWQHSAMYFAFMISGFVDLAGFYTELPPDSEQAALGVAFVVEALLLAFHLKGSDLEVTVHEILVITIAMSAITMFAEIGRKSSVLLTIGRSLLVILQGTWFIQIGLILYKHKPQWDPHSMNSTMMAPALYCLDIMLLTLGSLICFLVMRVVIQKLDLYLPLQQSEGDNDDPEAVPHRAGTFSSFIEADGSNHRSNGFKSVQLSAVKAPPRR